MPDEVPKGEDGLYKYCKNHKSIPITLRKCTSSTL